MLREFWSIQSWGWGSLGGHIEPLFLYLRSHVFVQEENWGTSGHLQCRRKKTRSAGVILPKEVEVSAEVVSVWTITISKDFINGLDVKNILKAIVSSEK